MKAYVSDSLNDIVENVMAYAKSSAASGLSQSDFRKNRLQLKEAGTSLANDYINNRDQAKCLSIFQNIHKLLVECTRMEFSVHSAN